MVEHLANQNNIVVSYRSAAQRKVVVRGALGDLLNMFPADLHMFHHASGNYRGRQGHIYVPRELKNRVTGVFGFDTRKRHKSAYRFHAIAAGEPTSHSGRFPTDFVKRYNFPTEYRGRNLDGSGQCIALVELGGGFSNSDLEIYFKAIDVPKPRVVAVSVDRAVNHPTRFGSSDAEVMMDIECAGAAAPGAKIALYFAPSRGNGLLDAVSAAVHDSERNPGVVSISWGSNEDPDEPSNRAFHEIFTEAAALGITICVASGDHGTAGDSDHTDWDRKHHVDFPSADDLVLACGGTQIDEKGRDIAWNDGQPFGGKYSRGGWAGGGGISDAIKRPHYQRNAGIPKSIFTRKRGRGVPDIAMNAERYFLRWQGKDRILGGTSCVAPLMAGLVARLNQAKGKNVGFLNPFLYAKAKKGVVKDVTDGTNGIYRTIKGYRAKRGWDGCTGLGTPDGQRILENL
jgi:kumamolisin